jgi:hypothetical protein
MDAVDHKGAGIGRARLPYAKGSLQSFDLCTIVPRATV